MARLPLVARSRRAAVAAVLALSVAGLPVDAAASARSDYERLLARVESLRLDGPRPTPRPQLRRVIADAESLARRHGGSGYADNALWQAATVALASWRVYRQPSDRTQGLQLLDTLVRRYPSSSLVSDARALIKRHGPSTAPATSVARATTPPPSPTPSRSPAGTGAAATPTTRCGRRLRWRSPPGVSIAGRPIARRACSCSTRWSAATRPARWCRMRAR